MMFYSAVIKCFPCVIGDEQQWENRAPHISLVKTMDMESTDPCLYRG